MKKLLEKITVIIMTFAVVFGSVAFTNTDWLNFNANAEEKSCGGECGERLYWTYDNKNKRITISGSGKMYDYSGNEGSDLAYGDESDRAPWHTLKDEVKEVIICDGVQSVGECSFSFFERLETVSLPESVMVIGRNAFENCTELVNIDLPTNLDKLEGWAFLNCTSLKSIDITNSVICRNTFEGCTSLENVVMHYWIRSIGNMAFFGCTSLNNIVLPENLSFIGSNAFSETGYYNNASNWDNGVLYIGKYLVEANNVKGTCFIKNGTKLISYRAFVDCDELDSVIIPASVKCFGEQAFLGCTDLKNVIALGRKMEVSILGCRERPEFTVYCYSDSDLYKYAEESDVNCVVLDGIKPGDCNSDGCINSSDALDVLRFAVATNPTINEKYIAMDVNLDESINSSDALAILQRSVGLIDRFKCSSVTELDKENLGLIMSHILWYNDEFIDIGGKNGFDYDCTSEDAFVKAFNGMVNFPYYNMFDLLNYIYDGIDHITVLNKEQDDPRNAFPYEYSIFDGEVFDEIMTTVFNVTPDHDFVLRYEKDNYDMGIGSIGAYYEDGNYYSYHFDGGDGCGPGGDIVGCKKTEDGSYLLDLNYYIVGCDGRDLMSKFDVTAELVNLNGKRFWSIKNFSCKERFLDVN